MSLEEWKSKLEGKTELDEDDLPGDGDDWEQLSQLCSKPKP